MSGVQQQSAPSALDLGAFILQLRRLVLDETARLREGIHQNWARPLGARVSDGRAIEGVRIIARRDNGTLELACNRNDSRFREGDVLLLNRGNPFETPRIHVSLEEDNETSLLVSPLDLGVDWGLLARTTTGWVLDEGYMDLSQSVLDALNEAGETATGRTRVLPLLMGLARPALDGARFDRGMDLADAFELESDSGPIRLNERQKEALASAYATDLAYLIQGPPGTGKTLVLALIAQALAEDGERVLVTAFTHRAINNAIEKIAKTSPHLPVAKIGRDIRARDLPAPNYEYFDMSPMAEITSGYIIGATPFATRNKRLGGVTFDTVIFDEASQITLPLAVMAMLTAKRYIFIGDHRQLPPVLTKRYTGGALNDSVFGALTARGFDTMLDETARMNAEITAWPSAQFYDGLLRPLNASVAQRRLQLSRPPARFAHILDPREPKVFVDLRHRAATSRSRPEADLIAGLVEELLACGVPAREIGIVAPFRAQGREIRNLLRRLIPDSEARQQIVTDTVERMQGQEREVVLISLTTSNPAYAASLAEFYFQPERLNVAVTRPRSKLIIVGSSHVLQAIPESEELRADVELLRNLLRSCTLRLPQHQR